MKFLNSFQKFNSLLIREMISEDDVESSYLKMRPKRIKEFNTKLLNVFKDDINKYNNFAEFKKSIILSRDGSETNIYAPKLSSKYSNLTFQDKDLKDWWDYISRSDDDLTRVLFNLFQETKGNPERAKTFYDKGGDKIVRYDCKINSVDEIKVFGPFKDKNGSDCKIYKILLPKHCLDIFKNKKFAIGEHGDKRNIYIELEKYANKIHFPVGIAQELRGNELGQWIYLAMIKKLGYITSSPYNTPAIKQVYTDLVSLPKFEKEVMTLLLQYDVLIFDRNTNLDVKKIFREFIFNKFTDEKSVKCSPALKEILGEEYKNWYESLSLSQSKESIERKIKMFDEEEPSYGDIVWDAELKRIFKCNGVWNSHPAGGKTIQLRHDYEIRSLPYDTKRYKVIVKTQNF
jgi:hypothetical protein